MRFFIFCIFFKRKKVIIFFSNNNAKDMEKKIRDKRLSFLSFIFTVRFFKETDYSLATLHLQHEIYNISRILINSQVWNRKDFYRPAENIWFRKSESLRWVIKNYIRLVFIGKNMHKRMMPKPGWTIWLRYCIWFIVKQATGLLRFIVKQATGLLRFIVKQATGLLRFIVKQATGLLRFIVKSIQGYSGLL